jgi:hypothetical protein
VHQFSVGFVLHPAIQPRRVPFPASRFTVDPIPEAGHRRTDHYPME